MSDDDDLREQNEKLRMELHACRAALRPFALYAKCLPPVIPDTFRDTDDTGVMVSTYQMQQTYTLTFGDLRRALECFNKLTAVEAP